MDLNTRLSMMAQKPFFFIAVAVLILKTESYISAIYPFRDNPCKNPRKYALTTPYGVAVSARSACLLGTSPLASYPSTVLPMDNIKIR